MNKLHLIFTSLSALALAACGGSSGGSSDETGGGDGTGNGGSGGTGYDIVCAAKERSVNWDKLKTINVTNLSEYGLFDSQCDPTKNPSARGLAYDLSVPLFTDYATKYRFVFIPENEKATYVSGAGTETSGGKEIYIDDDTLNYPVGTVITKTFSLPSDTADRGFDKENLIETRLLIRRDSGWIALPYVWNADKTDAVLDFNGELYADQSLTHKSETLYFDYGVPDPQKCKRCHQAEGKTAVIGPKVRYLNMDYDYGDAIENQLTRWVSEGLLDGTSLPDLAPANLPSVPQFDDATDIAAIQPETLEAFAKGWLDINCAHCHNPVGDASNTNMHVEFTRDFAQKNEHGVCQKPISFGGEGLDYIIKPGDAAKSIMVYRMGTRDGGDRMPPLGRDLVHDEGVELVTRWVNSLSGTCTE